ncbi:MAG: putative lipid II flippase FtsW [Lentisphaerae bacterium]|nr:putative lipid II flippase FtsW [Lentisphaerota bacterium]
MGKIISTLIGIVLILLALGIVMLASTSSVRGAAVFDDPYYFLKRQLVWLVLSVGVGIAMIRFDYHWWHKAAVPLGIVAVIGLILVFVPGLGRKIGGSNRWIRIAPLPSLQPSEFAKFACVVCLARWISDIGRHMQKLKDGVVLPLGVLGLVLLLLILEPDFGTTLLVGAVGMMILFAGGARIDGLAIFGAIGISAFIVAIMHDPVRMGRILAFIMPDQHPEAAHQLAQSKLAFIRGEVIGVGLGESIQKQFYLPEAHNDFILAIIGEELGFVATIGVVLLFIGIVICGIIISMKATDRFGRLLAFGITMMICLQAAINIGVVTGCLPTKGLPLPFISYGGSSMLISVVYISVLVNIALHCDALDLDKHTKPIKDRAHRL